MLGPGGYHQFVGDWDSCVNGEDLALFLFARVDGQWEAGVDADVELCHVVVQVGLADLSVCGQDVLNQRAEVHAVESFCRIIEDGVVDIVNGGSELVSSVPRTRWQVAHAFRAAMLMARSSSRCWMLAPFGMTGYVGGSAAGIVNAAPFRAK